jgi:hypothetical protein
MPKYSPGDLVTCRGYDGIFEIIWVLPNLMHVHGYKNKMDYLYRLKGIDIPQFEFKLTPMFTI